MGIFAKFTKTTHQICSCYVTLASNSENLYFSPNSVLNFRQSYQIRGKLAQEQKSYRQKQIRGWKTLPTVLIGLRSLCNYDLFLFFVSPFKSLGPFFDVALNSNDLYTIWEVMLKTVLAERTSSVLRKVVIMIIRC